MLATSAHACSACSAWVIWAALKRWKPSVSLGMLTGAVERNA
jgi:hypothetical protein